MKQNFFAWSFTLFAMLFATSSYVKGEVLASEPILSNSEWEDLNIVLPDSLIGHYPLTSPITVEPSEVDFGTDASVSVLVSVAGNNYRSLKVSKISYVSGFDYSQKISYRIGDLGNGKFLIVFSLPPINNPDLELRLEGELEVEITLLRSYIFGDVYREKIRVII